VNLVRTFLGKLIFWASWPALYIYLRDSQRSRVVIEADGNFLMLRGWHDGSRWSLPGGGVHKNEHAAASAVREVREETGIQLKENDLVNLGPDKYAERGLNFDIHRYGCRLIQKPETKKQYLEVIDLRWISSDELTEQKVDKATWRHIQTWKQHR
jgi:8-oxo-dGTP pyrophosphatase MutT (NUDIX family)